MPALEQVEGLPDGLTALVAPDAAGIAEAAAERITQWLTDALKERASAHLALTGGSSAGHLAAELQKPRWRQAVAWQRVHLWWGDERFVPADQPESNFGAAYHDLLTTDGPPVQRQNVHAVPVDTALAQGRDAAWAASMYLTELLTNLPRNAEGAPAFDVILLGMGPDGHILSVFPHSPALEPDAPLVMAVPPPISVDPKLPRVTLSPRLLDAAGHVLMMIAGASKALRVEQVLTGDRDPHDLPAQLATGPNAVWLLDRAAAAELEGLQPVA